MFKNRKPINANVKSNTGGRPSGVAKTPAIIITLGVLGVALTVSVAPAAARKAGDAALTPRPPVVRDHRPAPVIRDHRSGVRDHRGSGAPGGGVVVTNGKVRRVPCLGNLC